MTVLNNFSRTLAVRLSHTVTSICEFLWVFVTDATTNYGV